MAGVLGCDETHKFAKLFHIQIRDGPKLEAIFLPRKHVVSLNCLNRNRGGAFPGRGPDEEIDDMQFSAVHQHGDRSILDVVKPAADERETVIRKVHDGRCEIQFTVEPGFHGVLVGRLHIEQMARLQ